jgi:hypothetical protein
MNDNRSASSRRSTWRSPLARKTFGVGTAGAALSAGAAYFTGYDAAAVPSAGIVVACTFGLIVFQLRGFSRDSTVQQTVETLTRNNQNNGRAIIDLALHEAVATRQLKSDDLAKVFCTAFESLSADSANGETTRPAIEPRPIVLSSADVTEIPPRDKEISDTTSAGNEEDEPGE